VSGRIVVVVTAIEGSSTATKIVSRMRPGGVSGSDRPGGGHVRKGGAYRPELEGLRALAATLVVVYHVWLGRVSGGVDVFFLISGFLITGQVARGYERGERVLARVWSRMARRLLPSVTTVLLAVVGLSLLLLPEDRWFKTIREVAASALFVENWELARDSTDYFAQHDEASVLQHFWSLSVQGQFYLVWPVLIGLVVFAVNRLRLTLGLRLTLRPTLACVLGVVLCCSLAYSVHLTVVDQPLAYFDSLTRAWEFALGGLLALGIDAVVLPHRLRVVAGWVGVAGLASCGLVLEVGRQFPGWAALWPTLSGAAVLLAGVTGSRVGADRLLASRPMRYLGGLGFAWYLWHWPVLVFSLLVRERPEPGLLGGAAVILISLALAAATYRFVEVPLRNPRSVASHPAASSLSASSPSAAARAAASPPAAARTSTTRRSTIRLLAFTLVPALLAAGGWELLTMHRANNYTLAADDPDHPGARSLEPGFTYSGQEKPHLRPAFVRLSQDWGTTQGMTCSMSGRGAGLEVCTSETVGAPNRRVVVVGDSHPTQFLAALRPIAAERNWELIVMSRGGCAFSTDSEIRPGDQACLDWNAAAMNEILADHPDFVFTMATRDLRAGHTERTPPGFVAQWRRLDTENIRVLAVRDNPRFTTSPGACVEAHGADDPRCDTPRSDLLTEEAPYESMSDIPSNVTFLDFSDSYCGPAICPAVVGNVLVYKDDNHVSATYVATMVGVITRAIDDALVPYGAGPS